MTPRARSRDAHAAMTFADLHRRLGFVPLERIRMQPAPGTATETDVEEAERRDNRLCELVDGVLVEKTVGYSESVVAMTLGSLLRTHAQQRKLGVVSGSDGMLRLFPGLVRIPDVAFVCYRRLPGGKVPRQPVPDLVPDLVAEVLSEGNTREEMARRLREYFDAGVRLVWMIDPRARTATVYTAPERKTGLAEKDTLKGGRVLPGFAVRVGELFADLPASA